jgi:hypothetical protein
MRTFSEKFVEKQNKFYDQKLFPENRAVYDINWKNMVEADSPQMTIQYGSCALHAG